MRTLEDPAIKKPKAGINRLAASTYDRDSWITVITRLATRANAGLDDVPEDDIPEEDVMEVDQGAFDSHAPFDHMDVGSAGGNDVDIEDDIPMPPPSTQPRTRASARKDDDSEKDSGVSFGERLREAKDREEEEASDEEKKLNLTEQDGTLPSFLLSHVAMLKGHLSSSYW